MHSPRLENTTLSYPVRVALAILSATIVAISSPGTPLAALSWLSWAWIVPLGLALNHSNPRSALCLSLLSAMLFWSASVWWLIPALQQFANTGLTTTLVLFLLICLLCALPYGIFGLLYGYCQWLDKRAGAWRTAIAMTVIICWIPSLIPGYPAHSQFQNPTMIQILEIGGLPLLTFAMAVVQWHLISAIVHWFKGLKSEAWQPLAIAILIMASLAAYGQWRINAIESSMAAAEKYTVAFIQPNFVRADSIDPLFDLSEQVLTTHKEVDLLVWPEFPPAFSITENAIQRRRTLALSQEQQIDMMVVSGYVYSEKIGGQPRNYYNASHLIKNGELTDSYAKQTLVPFFEYLPFSSILKPYFPDTLRYIPGEKTTLFKASETVNIIPVICYEVIFPDNIKEFVRQGGNLIINPVSDTWFGNSTGSIHHLSLALFRTVENRIPWVRATNSGISAVVQATGKIEQGSMTGLKQRTSAVHEIAISGQGSTYSRWGDWFLYLITVLFAIDLFWQYKQRNEN